MAKRMVRQTEVVAWRDIFQGAGDFEPTKTDSVRYETRLVEVKPPTKPQRKKLIQRLIDKLDPPRPVIAKEKTVKRAPKPKAQPKPKKGPKVGKVNIVTVKSPNGHEQPIPLVADLRELLLDGWQIVGDDATVNQAYAFLEFNPEEHHA